MKKNDILISEESTNTFKVIINEKTVTDHIVIVSDLYYQKLTNKKVTKTELLDFTFRFLLQKESNTSILKKFDLTVVSKYFPDYVSVTQNWINNFKKI